MRVHVDRHDTFEIESVHLWLPDHGLGDERRLLGPLDLDGDEQLHLNATADLPGLLDLNAARQRDPTGSGAGNPRPVKAIVDPDRGVGHGQRLLRDRSDQGEGQEPMSDRATERRGRGPLGSTSMKL